MVRRVDGRRVRAISLCPRDLVTAGAGVGKGRAGSGPGTCRKMDPRVSQMGPYPGSGRARYSRNYPDPLYTHRSQFPKSRA